MLSAPRFGIWAAVHGSRASHHDPNEPDDASWERNRALVLEAEALEFDAVLVAQHTMNPYDAVGTTRMPTSVSDRMCRLAVDYQDAEAERGIVGRRTGIESPRLVADAVALTRATRDRDDVRQGSSVRGAIDIALVAAQLAAMRGVSLPDEPAVTSDRR